ncbi:MAG: lipase family protein [Pirellulales bacterium]|nr:lipase family protein [Pirellulales bacterium]
MMTSEPKPAAETKLEVGSAVAAKFDCESLAAVRFDWQAALSFALASELSYRSAPEAVAQAAAWGLSGCEFFDYEETQCLLAETPDVLLVAFRGTESFGDWLADLNVRSVRRPYGTLHRGFYQAFQDVAEPLTASLTQRTAAAARPLAITGHSLGGALATVAAAEYQWQFSIANIYTFGQPRVGKGTFERRFSDFGLPFYRFVNDDDVVTRVPPGFSHVGRLVRLNGKGEASFAEALSGDFESEPEPLTNEEFDLLRSQLLAQRAHDSSHDEYLHALDAHIEGLFPSFRDHKLNNYIRKIARQANRQDDSSRFRTREATSSDR